MSNSHKISSSAFNVTKNSAKLVGGVSKELIKQTIENNPELKQAKAQLDTSINDLSSAVKKSASELVDAIEEPERKRKKLEERAKHEKWSRECYRTKNGWKTKFIASTAVWLQTFFSCLILLPIVAVISYFIVALGLSYFWIDLPFTRPSNTMFAVITFADLLLSIFIANYVTKSDQRERQTYYESLR
ncbi:hypothetical protein [Vibrio campbellii]|uniref:hypothetical protein n=1 Tax=Vibrio campbellii TaxID=680 RepID=UPI0012D4BC0D|nr:hypothetical protein [Vibrio campbellii]